MTAAGAGREAPAPLSARAELALEGALILAASALVAWLGTQADVYTADSYFYLSKAAGLISGRGLRVSWNDGIDRTFFSGYAFALALPMRLFGEAGFVPAAALLHAWTGASLLQILRLTGQPFAVRLGALALALFNPLALWWASVPMSEVLLVALSTAAVLEAMRFRETGRRGPLAAAAVLGGLAFVTRAEGLLVSGVLAALAGPRLYRERRLLVLAPCAAAVVGPELAHWLFLRRHQLPGRASMGYLEQAAEYLADIHVMNGFASHVRAPFWTAFRYDTESWLYARYFPDWLANAQAIVAGLYLASLLIALGLGLWRRRLALVAWCAGLIGYALLHSLWIDQYERFDDFVVPVAASLFAIAVEAVLRRFGPAASAAALLGVAAVSGTYGAQLSRMHTARLKLHQGGRDYRALGRLASSVNPERRPFVTDLGPYLAVYLNGHALFTDSKPSFYDAAVPKGLAGRVFLAEVGAAAIVSKRPAQEVAREFELLPGEYHEVSGPATLLVLDLPRGPWPPP